MRRQHAAQLRTDGLDLRRAPGACELQPFFSGCIALVQPHHARKALARGRQALGCVVGAGVQVVRRVELAAQAIDVGRGGEELVHHVPCLAAPFDALGQRAHRRAHHAVVGELATHQALGVGAAGGQHALVAEGDQVGGGAADVDQHAFGEHERGMPRGREPVGRGDVLPVPCHVRGRAPARIAGKEMQRARPRGQRGRQCGGDAAHAGFAVGEQVDHLARHGDGMLCGGKQGPARACGLQRTRQMVEALPERTAPLRHVDHLAALQQAGLDMGAADVPADGGAFRRRHAQVPVLDECRRRAGGPPAALPPGCGPAPPRARRRRR